MGLIKAGMGALGGTLADQWKEFFYCESMPKEVLVTKGQKRTTGRSSNTKGNDNIISNGSGIAVADGQCMIIVEQGKVVEVCAEPDRKHKAGNINMWFKYNINGITIQLQITEYQKTDPQNWDDFWCHIVLYLESPPWLSFHMEDECLLSCEIDNLIHYLTLFCNHQLSETTTIECVEPNFSFVLNAKEHTVNWNIFFWSDKGTITGNHLSLALHEDEASMLLTYFKIITGILSERSPVVTQLIRKSILY